MSRARKRWRGTDAATRDGIVGALRRGLAGSVVALRYGVHENTVYALARKNGIDLSGNRGGGAKVGEAKRSGNYATKLTPAMLEHIRALRAAGAMQKDICRQVGLSWSTVASAFKKLGLSGRIIHTKPVEPAAAATPLRQSRRDRLAARDNRLRELVAQGKSDADIAGELGCSADWIKALRQKQRLLRPKGPAKNPPFGSEDDATLRQMFKAGKKDGDIAAALGRSSGAVYQRRRELGLKRQGPRIWLRLGKQAVDAGPVDPMADQVKVLRRAGFAVHREGELYRVGTVHKSAAELAAMATRWARQMTVGAAS